MTYTATGTVSATSGGTLVNTAVVLPPSGVADLEKRNDLSTVSTPVTGACTSQVEVLLSNMTVSTPEVYEACSTITVGPNFVVMSLGDVTFRAGEKVIVMDGFEAESGAKVTIELILH